MQEDFREKLQKLEGWLRTNKYPEAHIALNKLIKFSTLTGIKSLGFNEAVSKMINEIVGDKWDYQTAKWWLQSYGLETLPKEFRHSWTIYSEGYLANLIRSLDLIEELVKMSSEDRNQKYKDKKFDPIRDIVYKKFGKFEDESGPIWESEDDAGEIRQLTWLYSEIYKEIKEKFERFIDKDFFYDLYSNKSFDKNLSKKLSYQEAMELYVEDVKIRNMPVVLDLGDYRWVDSGNTISEFVRKKMKNCGSPRWGALRSEDFSSLHMLLLLDLNNNPHVIATWTPEYVDYVSKDKEPKRYLGGIEGVGSKPPKSIYYPHIKELVNFLKPELINITSKKVFLPNGESLDNDALGEYLGVRVGGVYPYQLS